MNTRLESGDDRTMGRKYVKEKLAYELHWINVPVERRPSLEIRTVPTLDDAQIAFRQTKSECGNRFRIVGVDAILKFGRNQGGRCFPGTPAFLSRA
jgi:hypothetical protein